MSHDTDALLVARVTAALRSGQPQTIALGGLPPVTVQPMMLSACAWCGTALESKPCPPEQAGQTSHGICPGCYPSELVALLGGEG